MQIVTHPLQRILVGELGGITDDVLLNAIGDLPEGFPIRVTDEERARWAREFRLQRSLMTEPNRCRQNGWCTHVASENNGIANIRRHNNLARGTGPHCLGKEMTARCIFCPYKCAHKKSLVEHYKTKLDFLPAIAERLAEHWNGDNATLATFLKNFSAI